MQTLSLCVAPTPTLPRKRGREQAERGARLILHTLPRFLHKKAKRYRPQPAVPNTSTSLDGRVLGRMRTCGFDTLQYDGFGVPYGPYCH
jgi:hypothetical protein